MTTIQSDKKTSSGRIISFEKNVIERQDKKLCNHAEVNRQYWLYKDTQKRLRRIKLPESLIPNNQNKNKNLEEDLYAYIGTLDTDNKTKEHILKFAKYLTSQNYIYESVGPTIVGNLSHPDIIINFGEKIDYCCINVGYDIDPYEIATLGFDREIISANDELRKKLDTNLDDLVDNNEIAILKNQLEEKNITPQNLISLLELIKRQDKTHSEKCEKLITTISSENSLDKIDLDEMNTLITDIELFDTAEYEKQMALLTTSDGRKKMAKEIENETLDDLQKKYQSVQSLIEDTGLEKFYSKFLSKDDLEKATEISLRYTHSNYDDTLKSLIITEELLKTKLNPLDETTNSDDINEINQLGNAITIIYKMNIMKEFPSTEEMEECLLSIMPLNDQQKSMIKEKGIIGTVEYIKENIMPQESQNTDKEEYCISCKNNKVSINKIGEKSQNFGHFMSNLFDNVVGFFSNILAVFTGSTTEAKKPFIIDVEANITEEDGKLYTSTKMDVDNASHLDECINFHKHGIDNHAIFQSYRNQEFEYDPWPPFPYFKKLAHYLKNTFTSKETLEQSVTFPMKDKIFLQPQIADGMYGDLQRGPTFVDGKLINVANDDNRDENLNSIIDNSKSNFLKKIENDNINLQNLSLLMLHPDTDKFRIGYRTYAFDDKLTIQEHFIVFDVNADNDLADRYNLICKHFREEINKLKSNDKTMTLNDFHQEAEKIIEKALNSKLLPENKSYDTIKSTLTLETEEENFKLTRKVDISTPEGKKNADRLIKNFKDSFEHKTLPERIKYIESTGSCDLDAFPKEFGSKLAQMGAYLYVLAKNAQNTNVDQNKIQATFSEIDKLSKELNDVNEAGQIRKIAEYINSSSEQKIDKLQELGTNLETSVLSCLPNGEIKNNILGEQKIYPADKAENKTRPQPFSLTGMFNNLLSAFTGQQKKDPNDRLDNEPPRQEK